MIAGVLSAILGHQDDSHTLGKVEQRARRKLCTSYQLWMIYLQAYEGKKETLILSRTLFFGFLSYRKLNLILSDMSTNFKEVHCQTKAKPGQNKQTKNPKVYDFSTPKAIPKSLNSHLQEASCWNGTVPRRVNLPNAPFRSSQVGKWTREILSENRIWDIQLVWTRTHSIAKSRSSYYSCIWYINWYVID